MSKDDAIPGYNPSSIEPKWQKKWLETKAFAAKDFDKGPKYYSLVMFPYPSGSGLHVGHPESYTASDILSRYKRANGFNVLQPIGWDAFGLPAEQYAVKTGTHPRETTTKNIDTFRRQIQEIGLGFDWDRQVDTTDPLYYKWTQWIFLKLFETGLAYVDSRPVWWCPELKTVLANEEVVDGKSEVGDFPVEKRDLRQWVLRITAYADRLQKKLETINWPESTKRQQIAWIGRSEGINFKQKVKGLDIEFEVYDSIPQTFIAQTFTVIAPDHKMLKRLVEGTSHEKEVMAFSEMIKQRRVENPYAVETESEGVFTGRYVDNPFGTGDLPIWAASYAKADYGTGWVNCSAHDDRDYRFAKKYGIPLKVAILPPNDTQRATRVTKIEECYLEPDGVLTAPAELAGMRWDEARRPVIEYIKKKGYGREQVNYKLRDWLFSRQRYWGEPFPILWLSEADFKKINLAKTKLVLPKTPVSYEEDAKKFFAVGLPFDSLPLELPETDDYKPSGNGESPLANIKEWVNIFVNIETGETNAKPKCDKCVSSRRETNTMPQWAGSCWYYLRYLSPHYDKALVDPAALKYWGMPDFYIGGSEHAVLHLLYARFWHQFLYDIGVVTQEEPFPWVFHQGMILGENSQRMSKSRGNVVNPDDVVKEYGADALRLYLMFIGPLEDVKPWSSKSIEGVHRFLRRAFREFIGEDGKIALKVKEAPEANPETEKLLHATIKKVSADIENLRFNTAISALMILLNQIQAADSISLQTAKAFVQLLSPFAPHLGEELWERLGGKGSVGVAPWPTYDESKLISSTVKIVVQINGKLRAELELSADVDEAGALAAAKANDKIQQHISGKEIKKVVFVKNRLLNIVAG